MSTFFFDSADTAAVQCLDEQGHGRRRHTQNTQPNQPEILANTHPGPVPVDGLRLIFDDLPAAMKRRHVRPGDFALRPFPESEDVEKMLAWEGQRGTQSPPPRRRASDLPTGDLNPFILPDWITQAAIYQDTPREPARRHRTAQDANAAWAPEYLVINIVHPTGDPAPIRRERLPAGDYHQPEILANTHPGDPPVDGLPLDTGEAPQARRRYSGRGETANILTQEPVFALIHTAGAVWPDQSTARPRVTGETTRTAAPAVYLPTDFAPTLDDWPVPRERHAAREGSTEQTGRPAIFESFELHHLAAPDAIPTRRPSPTSQPQTPQEAESTYLIHGTAPDAFPRPRTANRGPNTATASFDLFYQEAVVACYAADVSTPRHFDRTQHAQPFDWSGNAVPLPAVDDPAPVRKPRSQPGSIDRDTAEMGHEAITLSWVQDSPLPAPRNATSQPGDTGPRGFWNGIISISTPWSLAAGQFFQPGAIVGDLDE